MSSKQDTKYAAKRRAANRKRLRDLARIVFVYLFIGILIIGTASTVFVATSPASPNTPVATATGAGAASFAALVANGDQAVAAGQFGQAIGYYSGYLAQAPTDSDVMYKLGKAFVDPKNSSPDYLSGVTYLQRAVNANPSASWVGDANALIAQYQDKASADITATAGSLSPTNVVTGTSPSATGQPAITATAVITK